jgi:hypothetical protein
VATKPLVSEGAAERAAPGGRGSKARRVAGGGWCQSRGAVPYLTRMRHPFAMRQAAPRNGRFSFFSAFQGLAQSTVGRVFELAFHTRCQPGVAAPNTY